MGIELFRRPVLDRDPTETVLSTGTIRGFGLSVLAPTGSTADKTLSLPRPTQPGIRKTLWCNTTGVRVTNLTVAGATASGHFAGTTARTIAFSSLSTKKRDATLIAVSTSQWLIVARSTGTTLVG